MTELDGNDFDLFLLCETWRTEPEEFFKTCGGNQLFLSGGSTHAGVGICVGRKLARDIADASFHSLLLRTGVCIALFHGPCQIPGIRMLFPHNMGTRF